MIDKRSLEKMCEYPITPSLVGEIEPVKESARERADRIWKMEGKFLVNSPCLLETRNLFPSGVVSSKEIV